MWSDVVLGWAEVTQISAFPGALIRLCACTAPSLHPWYPKRFTASVLHCHTPDSIKVHLLKPLRLYQLHLVSQWELKSHPSVALCCRSICYPLKGAFTSHELHWGSHWCSDWVKYLTSYKAPLAGAWDNCAVGFCGVILNFSCDKAISPQPYSSMQHIFHVCAQR